ncbi:MAG: DUF4258 domain-containing protein [Treponema sp.]|jgi:hypothetical protein|nr:DUF4258 domain-containing protein [Treponema sp.]
MTIEDIVRYCGGQKLRWTSHVLDRLFQRSISIDDVVTALTNGEIIEHYPTDYPFPSCLVLGLTPKDKYLHIVCGSGGTELWLITAYFPNPAEWSADFRIRREETT